MATKIVTGFLNLTELNPIVLDTQTGVGCNLEFRGQVTLKELTALVATTILIRSLAKALDTDV
jgi:hypothetical protein